MNGFVWHRVIKAHYRDFIASNVRSRCKMEYMVVPFFKFLFVSSELKRGAIKQWDAIAYHIFSPLEGSIVLTRKYRSKRSREIHPLPFSRKATSWPALFCLWLARSRAFLRFGWLTIASKTQSMNGNAFAILWKEISITRLTDYWVQGWLAVSHLAPH